jgi:PKHD-type hydroxylase
MESPRMIIRIPAVLSAAQLATCQARLQQADWTDGRVTAGPQSARVKQNEQVAETCPVGRELGQMIVAEIERNTLFLSAALPRHVFPPLFNRYAAGMQFGAHIDNAIRTIPGTHFRIRTDLSATLFLAEPESYDGGELIIQDGDAAHSVKLPAGDIVLYPATTLHHVAPVTRGARVAAFFWVQSLIKDGAARDILHSMDLAIQELDAALPDSGAVVRLTGCYHNLVRRWSEF